MEKIGKNVSIISNVTLDKYGKMLLGTNIQSAYTTVSDMGVSVFGLNCSTGPVEMESSIRWLDEQNELPILVMPNAECQLTKAAMQLQDDLNKTCLSSWEFLQKQEVRMIGGCCGNNP